MKYAYVLNIYFTFLEVNVAITIKVETIFRGANVFREGGREIARGGGNISSWGEEIFSPPGDSVMGETLFRDTGRRYNIHTRVCRMLACVQRTVYRLH